MDISSFKIIHLILLCLGIYISGHILFLRLRKLIGPGCELTPNKLLTTYPILLLRPSLTGAYFGDYWNHLHYFLTEHGYHVDCSHQILDNSFGKNHILFSAGEIKLASRISIDQPGEIASLTYIYRKDSQLKFLEDTPFKHHIKSLRIPKANIISLSLSLAYRGLSLGPRSEVDVLSLGAFRFRDYYEQLLEHATILATEDLSR